MMRIYAYENADTLSTENKGIRANMHPLLLQTMGETRSDTLLGIVNRAYIVAPADCGFDLGDNIKCK